MIIKKSGCKSKLIVVIDCRNREMRKTKRQAVFRQGLQIFRQSGQRNSCSAAGYLLDRTDSYMFCGLQESFQDPAYRLRIIPIADCNIKISLALVMRRRHRPTEAEQTFIAILKKHLDGYMF